MWSPYDRQIQPTRSQTVLVPLLSAAIGLGGGLLGAYLGAHATIVTQRESAREDRLADARDRRAAVYTRFLAATDRNAVSAVRAAGSCRERRARTTCTFPARTESRYEADGNRFQLAFNEVVVYGSREALDVASRLANTLPRSLDDLERRANLIPADQRAIAYQRAYREFLNVMCKEVSADPRPTC